MSTRAKKNKITTKSYFTKRLRDCGYKVDKLSIDYPEDDRRKWTIMLDMSSHASSEARANVIVTCFHDGGILFYDGLHYLPNVKLKTDSIDVIVEYLNSKGIINKHPAYATEEWVDNYLSYEE